jgi:hypothetical protein
MLKDSNSEQILKGLKNSWLKPISLIYFIQFIFLHCRLVALKFLHTSIIWET